MLSFKLVIPYIWKEENKSDETKIPTTDFLESQLYNSSTSKLSQRNRFRSRLLIPIIYLILGLLLIFKDEKTVIGLILLIMSVIWYILHPFYSFWKYKRHYLKYIEENYKNRINPNTELDITEDSILAKGFTSEVEINRSDLSELKQLIELIVLDTRPVK